MGAWGEKTFEDDTSLDLIDEWIAAENPEDTIGEAIRVALADDYLEYDGGHVISVAAAILDYVINDQVVDAEVEGMDIWLQTLSRDRLAAMRQDVVLGIDKLLGDESELNELWAESEKLYPAWRKILESRKARFLVE